MGICGVYARVALYLKKRYIRTTLNRGNKKKALTTGRSEGQKTSVA